MVASRLRSKAQKFVIQRIEMHGSTLEMKSRVSLRKCREAKRKDHILYQMTDKDQITTVGDN